LPATPNTGSGGGGNDDSGAINYNGASGVVIARYRAPTACETFYHNGFWTCPPGVTSVQMLVVGGGGGGGCSQYADRGGAGGGAGAVIYRSSVTVTPNTTYPIIVGLPGAGNNTSPWNGSPGGYSAFGTNLIQNGDFGSSTGWTVGTGIAISGGVATYSSPSHGVNLQQTGVSFTSGVTYAVHFTVTSFTSGSLTLYGNYTTGTNTQVAFNIAQGVGNYYYTWTAASNGTGFSLQANAINNGACSMTIDNVAVYDITNSILSAGGGGGAGVGGTPAGQPGGSGGGGRNGGVGGAAYTGGNAGGTGNGGGAGGGGAGGVGSNGASGTSAAGGNGGAGVVYSISGRSKVYGGGGGGGNCGYSQTTGFDGSGSGLSAGSNPPGNGGGVNNLVVGGYGGSFITIPGGRAVPGTGSGGGGGGAIANAGIQGSNSAEGSGGVVVIRWGN
jgi:hypothetical protein